MFSDLLFISSESQRCSYRILVVRNNIVISFMQTSSCWKKDFEESIASVFIQKKMSTFHTNEFLPQMSSQQCYILAARIDLAKIMKLMLIWKFLQSRNISSSSRWSSNTLLKMDVVVINRSLNWSLLRKKLNFFSRSREEWVWSSLIGQILGCKMCLCCESSSKAGLEVFVVGFFITYSKSRASKWNFFLKLMNARVVNSSKKSSETM